jgi:hypothetical protein
VKVGIWTVKPPVTSGEQFVGSWQQSITGSGVNAPEEVNRADFVDNLREVYLGVFRASA